MAPLQDLGLTSAQQQQVVDIRARLEPSQKGQSQGAPQAEAPAELAELDEVSQWVQLWQRNSGPPGVCAALLWGWGSLEPALLAVAAAVLDRCRPACGVAAHR